MSDDFRYALGLGALLLLVLILVAYFSGSTRVIGALANAFGYLGNVFSGRTATGQFAAYPQGGAFAGTTTGTVPFGMGTIA